MYIKEIYVAEDATEFSNQQDCMEYEKSHNISNELPDTIRAYTDKFIPITVSSALDLATYIYFPECESSTLPAQKTVFNKLIYRYKQLTRGVNLNSSDRVYRYDESTNLFVSIDAEIHDLETLKFMIINRKIINKN